MLRLSQDNMVLVVVVVVIVFSGTGILIWEKINNREQSIMINRAGTAVTRQNGLAQPSAGKEGEEHLIIHITGEVKRAGVYKLPAGARVVDALQAAGGETNAADLDKINLAALIYDGDQIIIPALIAGQEIGLDNPGGADNSRININKASAEQLEELPGIGPSKAASIIKYRDKIGRITELNQLLEVSGIGPKTLEKIKEELTIR